MFTLLYLTINSNNVDKDINSSNMDSSNIDSRNVDIKDIVGSTTFHVRFLPNETIQEWYVHTALDNCQ
jgi:hypothetical protein